MKTWFRQLSLAQRVQIVAFLTLLGYALVRYGSQLRAFVVPSDLGLTLLAITSLVLLPFALLAVIRETFRQARAFRVRPVGVPRTPSAVIGQLLIPATVVGLLLAFVGWLADLRVLVVAAVSLVFLLPFGAVLLDNSPTPLFRRWSIRRRHVALVGLLAFAVRIIGGELTRGRASDPFEWLMLLVVIPCFSICWVAVQSPRADSAPASDQRLHN